MQYIQEGTEIILWGIGHIGQRIIKGSFGNYNVSFAVDSKVKAHAEKIENITVYSPQVLDDMNLEDKLIVIGILNWKEVAVDLEKRGKHIFRDYVPYIYLRYSSIDIGFLEFCTSDDERKAFLKKLSSGKKLCALYGFCHMNVYAPLLLRSKQFTENYCLLSLPNANSEGINLDVLKMPCIFSVLDLLVLGRVYPEEIFGTPDWKTVKSWVSSNCDVILVSNAAFRGYFPQHAKGIAQTKEQIWFGDKNLNKMIKEGKTVDEIIQIMRKSDFYDVDNINRFYENELRKLELSESECDVQISDYIRRYGRCKRLMYSTTHPIESVMKELTARLFAKMGLDTKMLESIPEDEMLSLKLNGEFIYPSVYNALGISEIDENERVCVGENRNVGLTLSEYVNLYVRINKPYLGVK